MTHGQLFAGIGGFGLAAEWAGIENVWANEIDPFCCKVLRKNFKGLEVYEEDIRNVRFSYVDIISGGFPCQPFSHAGKRKGADDDRYLWPEMLRVIQEVGPRWVIGENVAGLKSMENGRTLDRILTDLEDIGFDTETFSIPACGVGAWHRRDRIWIVGHKEHSSHTNANGVGSHREEININRETELRHQQERELGSVGKNVSDPSEQGLQKSRQRQDLRGSQGSSKRRMPGGRITEAGNYWKTEPNVGRVANGVPSRVDRLKGLGNAIVPQVAYEIFKAIT
jgi:DNA (cytosine-5)-methyltransferase 1